MKNFFKTILFPIVFRHVAALLIIGVSTLLLRPLNLLLGTQVIVLIYLLPVMVSTVLWGLTSGILAAFAAFLAFNYFFIPPYHTLSVHKTEDLITLIIFLIVAVVMSQLIGQAREGMRMARSREWEATRMYELISALAGLQDNQTIVRALAVHLAADFPVDQVEVYIDGKQDRPSITMMEPEDGVVQGKPDLQIPMLTVRGLEGEIRLWHQGNFYTQEQRRLLETFASQGALAIERIRLTEGENRSKVLEESDRMKSSLLSSVSHELRSPLAAIKASVSSLRSGTVDWNIPARQELLAMIEDESDHLNFLVGNLLDMSRIEAGSLTPHKRWNAIAEIAMGVAIRMRNQLQDYQLELNFPEDLPLVPTDYVMVEQVFTNLISNSIKYAPLNSTISISAQKDADFLHVRVSNQGPPVPEEHLERIFEKFYRVTAADRITGTGLGLSICKGIVEAHGGRIWATNSPCCFEFHFTLPLMMDGSLPQIPREPSDG